MPRFALIAPAALLLCSCGSRVPASNAADSTPPAATEAPATPPSPAPAPAAAAERWDLQSGAEGSALTLLTGSGESELRLFCPAGGRSLIVNVPAFRPVGSEERLSFGSGGEVVALVAGTGGDRKRGGVSATGDVPADLAALIGGPVSASYGAQTSGPHPAPPRPAAGAFVAACREKSAAPPAPTAAPAVAAGPCFVQDGQTLQVPAIRAVGTEPFWGARVEGRCVTYSHPDDQKGTRIWTRYTPAAGGGGTWSGALGGKRFELKARAAPGCSDGMSDRSYAFAVDLDVQGERRRGCAERL